MPKILVTRHKCDGSGKKRTYPITVNDWHKSIIKGSYGPQPLWYQIVTDPLGTVIAKVQVYEDRSRRLKDGLRFYRWDIYPAGANMDSGYSFARGECVKLSDALFLSEKTAALSTGVKVYNERIHKA